MLLPEIVAIGIYDSHIAAKNIAISKKRKTTMFEIELPIQNGGVSYIDSSSKRITTNTLICAKPGQIRNTKFPFKCYYVHAIIHDDVLYNKLMNTSDFLETESEVYKDIFAEMIKHYNTLAESEEIILQSLLLKLIYLISKESSFMGDNQRRAFYPSMVEKSLIYIKEHLTDDLSLENVAKSMSLSPTYFHNIFKSAVGKTLRDYVEEQRIKSAINLLLTTNYSLTQIAYECGFSSQSYFSYVFKRKMKQTTQEYVQEIFNKYEI